MNIKYAISFAILNVICTIFLVMIALFAIDLDIVHVPEVIRETKIIQNILGPAVPKEKDFDELYEDLANLFKFLEENEVAVDEIINSYNQVLESPVCSIANKNFNLLATQREDYINKLSQIERQIENVEKRYDRYVRLLGNIPEYSISLRNEKNYQFEKIIEPMYERLCTIKETYTLDREEVERMYEVAKKIADDMFYEYYELMCHIVNAEAGMVSIPAIERAYVMNVIENRIMSPIYPNTIHGVIYDPGQYAPVQSGSINKIPPDFVRKEVEEYLRGRVETGMPRNVLYQALFPQGSGTWKYMSSGHYFCYY